MQNYDKYRLRGIIANQTITAKNSPNSSYAAKLTFLAQLPSNLSNYVHLAILRQGDCLP